MIGGTCITHERDEMQSKFYSEILKGRDHFGDLRVDERIIFKQTLNK
jgi:hypothetical protein